MVNWDSEIKDLKPTQAGTDKDWASISRGGYYIMAKKVDGTLWACGDNHLNQLGLEDMVDRNKLTQVAISINKCSVHCGGYHTGMSRHLNVGYLIVLSRVIFIGLRHYPAQQQGGAA